MTRLWAINIVGYIEDESEKYDKDAITAMLNRKDITECFAPLKVVEVVVQTMTPEHSISPEDVSTRKLSQI
jgi:hypothetical protein